MRFGLFLDTNQNEEKPEGETKSKFWPTVFRAITVVLLGATIWVVAGSISYPLWWFEFIFKRGFLSWRLYQYGFTYLLQAETWLLVALAILALAVAFATWKVSGRVGRIIDRSGVYILAFCVLAGSIDAYCLNRTQRLQYELFSGLFKISDGITTVVIALTDLGLPPSQIVPPVDFLYVDKDRIAMLYSQVEPALVETKRTITSETKNDNSLDLERKPLTLKLGGSTESKETREYKGVDPSTTRECLELMNSLLARQFPPYYGTFAQLSSFQILTEAKETMKSVRESIPHQSLFTEKVPDGNAATLKQMADIRAKTSPAVIEDGIRSQLKEISGLVIVQGDFKRVSRGSGVAEFSEQFKGDPRSISFHFVLDDKKALRLLPDHGKRLVLADVIKKWDGGASIEIYPIAIF
jgi:hypothetical protein